MTVTLHKDDLPDGLDLGNVVAIDTETLGLRPVRDRLCLVQLSAGDGNAHLVQLRNNYAAPNLKKLLADRNVTKLFHFGRFDIAVMWMYLGVLAAPVYCTKISSKIARTFTGHHSLKNLCKDLLNIDIDKQQQTTDWGAETLTPEQIEYAATDVLYLHRIRAVLDESLQRENRADLARACFEFLPSRALLDAAGRGDSYFLRSFAKRQRLLHCDLMIDPAMRLRRFGLQRFLRLFFRSCPAGLFAAAQQDGDFAAATFVGDLSGGAATVVHQVIARASVEEIGQRFPLAVHGREHQRRQPLVVHRINVRPPGDEQTDNLEVRIAVGDRLPQGRAAVDIGPLRQLRVAYNGLPHARDIAGIDIQRDIKFQFGDIRVHAQHSKNRP